LVAEVRDQRDQAEQHAGRRQQNGQEVRELNSEESHVSFPKPAGRTLQKERLANRGRCV